MCVIFHYDPQEISSFNGNKYAEQSTTDKLIDLQQKMKDLEQDPNKGPTNVTNALFVGSTAELSKLIKNQNKDDK